MIDIEETDYTYWEQQEHIILPNYSDYVVYPKQGIIWSNKTNQWIGAKTKDGYWQCTLTSDDGTVWNTMLHRVIWQAVNGDIPKGYEINHIDENKDTNIIDNLELVTPKDNCNWGTRNERSAKARSKQVGAFKDGLLVMTFPSTKEAQRQGYQNSAVSKCCRGKLLHYKGFQWQYI